MVRVFGLNITKAEKKRKSNHRFNEWDREKAKLVRQGVNIDEKKHIVTTPEGRILEMSDRELIDLLHDIEYFKD